MSTNSCHCGSGAKFQDCCRPYLASEAVPPTAEALMRSRYSAFVEGDVDYILATHDPSTRSQVSAAEITAWAQGSEWLGLEILKVAGGGAEDKTGTLEFIARYRQRGVVVDHREKSEFRRRDNGRWYFLEGRIGGQETLLRVEPKIGRNDPCSCGSGLKFKKCCGN